MINHFDIFVFPDPLHDLSGPYNSNAMRYIYLVTMTTLHVILGELSVPDSFDDTQTKHCIVESSEVDGEPPVIGGGMGGLVCLRAQFLNIPHPDHHHPPTSYTQRCHSIDSAEQRFKHYQR